MYNISEIYTILLAQNYQQELFKELINPSSVISGNDINVCCPFHADSTPSFSISLNKPFYHCFGCGEDGDWVTYLQKTNGWQAREAIAYLAERAGVSKEASGKQRAVINYTPPPPPPDNINYTSNLIYMIKRNDALLAHDKALAWLLKTRGINKKTVENTGIGIDKEKQVWVFPCINKKGVSGFEFRRNDWSLFSDGSKCHKQKGTKSEIVMINTAHAETRNCIVMEGFLDAYCYYQFLYEQGKHRLVQVLTPSCGVNTLVSRVAGYDFSIYEKVTFILDNDEPGRDVMSKLNELYPHFIFSPLPALYKDFGEWYLKKVTA